MLPQPIPPTKKQIWDRSKNNPRQAKSSKGKAPQPISHLTMKKWSTVSPQCRHIMNQSTKSNLLNLKLSPVGILFQAAHQTKKETRLGAFTLHRSLYSPYTFSRKDNGGGILQFVTIRPDVKIPIRFQLPSHPVSNIQRRSISSQYTKKDRKSVV